VNDKPNITERPLLGDIRQLIDAARQRAAVAVNAEISLLYWQVGQRIHQSILQGERAEYGKQVIASLSKQLMAAYGKGWSTQQLRHCVNAAEAFPDKKIFYTLCRELSWSHLRVLIYMDDPLKRDFYIEMSRMEHWSVRQLRERIDAMLFERTALSKKPDATIAHDLKLGNFKHEHKSQMELYLRWLTKYELEPDEQAPLGIILCAGKKHEQIELLELDQSSIHVAEYLTTLPSKEILAAKLHESIQHAKQRMVDDE